MKIKRYLLSTFCLCLFTACDSDDNLLCYGTHTEIEGDVTTFGAVGDGKTDCSKAINSAIASLPSEGGVVVIPEGDFVLDAPIVINKHNVTFKGLNPGMRSNIDVNGINELLGPGGGSKYSGGSKWGNWGCIIGTLVGLLFLPWGIILGPFLGAVIGELLGNKEFSQALKSGVGSLLGFIFGTLLKFVVCGYFCYQFIIGLIR